MFFELFPLVLIPIVTRMQLDALQGLVVENFVPFAAGLGLILSAILVILLVRCKRGSEPRSKSSDDANWWNDVANSVQKGSKRGESGGGSKKNKVKKVCTHGKPFTCFLFTKILELGLLSWVAEIEIPHTWSS